MLLTLDFTNRVIWRIVEQLGIVFECRYLISLIRLISIGGSYDATLVDIGFVNLSIETIVILNRAW